MSGGTENPDDGDLVPVNRIEVLPAPAQFFAIDRQHEFRLERLEDAMWSIDASLASIAESFRGIEKNVRRLAIGVYAFLTLTALTSVSQVYTNIRIADRINITNSDLSVL